MRAHAEKKNSLLMPGPKAVAIAATIITYFKSFTITEQSPTLVTCRHGRFSAAAGPPGLGPDGHHSRVASA